MELVDICSGPEYYLKLPNGDEIYSVTVYVTSGANGSMKIARIEVEINGQKVQQKFTPNKETVTWAELPLNDKKEYTFQNYRYYDKEGNTINEFE